MKLYYIMPAGNIVYNPSSSTHSSVKKTKTNSKGPIYARVIKKSTNVNHTKKGIKSRRDSRRQPVVKRKPTKKNKSTRSSTVYVDLNLGSPKKSNKNTRIRSSRTPLKRMGSNGKLTSANNNSSPSNRENVGRVLRNVKNANPLSKSEAQNLLKRAMNSN